MRESRGGGLVKPTALNVILIKPSKYGKDGYVERFRWGFMPNATLPYLRSMTPSEIDGIPIQVSTIDEYVMGDTDYLARLKRHHGEQTLVALVAVQSHQFHRAGDIAALAYLNGCLAVIGGPHPMTCNTEMLQGRGVSFALAEAETVWPAILSDAVQGKLKPIYGHGERWAKKLEPPVLIPASREELSGYIIPMVGIYPARGCVFRCNFCSVVKITGQRMRSQPVAITIESIRRAKAAGIRLIMFVSDNFNKYKEVVDLLTAMIEERFDLPFFCQCDTQIVRQPELLELLKRAGCFQIFLGVESLDRKTLLAAKKAQNHPEKYWQIVAQCRRLGISTHFSQIIGFPEDTEHQICDQVEQIRDIGPTVASFYTLCPIPGTEQYDDFMRQGVITEENLDRFDGTCSTWQHPNLSGNDLDRLFRNCYRRFYTAGHALRNLRYLKPGPGGILPAIGGSLGYGAFARYSAWRGRHPMSGGVASVKTDHVRDYIDTRRTLYGLSHFPLPESLSLTAEEEKWNSQANPAVFSA